MKLTTSTVLLAAALMVAGSHSLALTQTHSEVTPDEYHVYSDYLQYGLATSNDVTKVRFALSMDTFSDRYLRDSSLSQAAKRMPECEGVPDSVLEGLDVTSRDIARLDARSLSISNVAVLSQQQLDAYFDTAKTDGWVAFRRDFPNSGGLRSFSRVAFDSTHTWAAFYSSRSNGGFDADVGVVVMWRSAHRWNELCYTPVLEA